MSMNIDDELYVMEEDGTEHKLDVLISFENAMTGKTYVIYTENMLDDEGNVVVNASVFEPDGRLLPVETPQEWDVIERILEELQRRIRRSESVDDLEDWINRIVQSEEC